MLGYCVVFLLCGCYHVQAAFQPRQIGEVADGLDPVELKPEQEIYASQYDVILVITNSLDNLVGELAPIARVVRRYQEVDKTFGSSPSFVPMEAGRPWCLIFANTGPLDRDIVDDVRRFEDTAKKGIQRVIQAGKKRPLLVLPKTDHGEYDTDLLVTLLGALQPLYMTLELRNAYSKSPVEYIGVWGAEEQILRHTIELATTLERARILTRDICATDPERMAPPRAEAHLRKVFNATRSVSMEVISDVETLQREYPALAAVNRAANQVERHRGRLIYMEYKGQGATNRTLYLLGKGITFDSGGANIKIRMASMHRDKCGAAVVAGFMKVLSILQPPNLRVVAAMPFVRNSIGEESYTADEIITARSGAKLRVINTDAEGRMIMVDVLCKIKELARNAINPHIVTIATLTGHARRTAGEHYSVVLDNGPARAINTAQQLMTIGDQFADPLEMSRLRREDFGKTQGLSSNRGHQTPMAFLMEGSGLHPAHTSTSSEKPLPLTHFDIVGPSLIPGVPDGSPLVALTAHFLLSAEDRAMLSRGTKEDEAVRQAKKEKEEEEREKQKKKKSRGYRYRNYYRG